MLKRAPKSSSAGTKRGRSEVSLNQSKSKKLIPDNEKVIAHKNLEEEQEEEEKEEEKDDEEEVVLTSATSTLDTTAAVASHSSSLQPASFPRIVSYFFLFTI